MLPLHTALLVPYPTSISETFTFPIARWVPVANPSGGLTRTLGVLPSSGDNCLAIENLPGCYRLQPDEAPVTHFGLYPLQTAACLCLLQVFAFLLPAKFPEHLIPCVKRVCRGTVAKGGNLYPALKMMKECVCHPAVTCPCLSLVDATDGETSWVTPPHLRYGKRVVSMLLGEQHCTTQQIYGIKPQAELPLSGRIWSAVAMTIAFADSRLHQSTLQSAASAPPPPSGGPRCHPTTTCPLCMS